jgi:sugar/nucleoside kinase (ribokinase family)
VVTAAPPEVIHIGSACRDIAPDDPRGWRLGGGVTYSALTTARLGLRTAAVVGVDDAAQHASELDLLREAGADLLLVPLSAGPIYHNVETPAGRVQTIAQKGVPLPVPPLPESWIASRAWMVAPVADEVHDEWIAPIPDGAFVAVAWQGLLRNLVDGERVTRKAPEASALIRRADVVGVSHHDVAPETPLRELWSLLRPGAVLAVTQGHEGGLLLTLGGNGPIQTLRWRATLSDREVDPTGAGDTFLSALVATAAHPNIGVRQRTLLDLRVAAAAGSLVVEDWGLAGVPDRAQVITRLVRERVRRIFGPARADTVGSYAPHEGKQ